VASAGTLSKSTLSGLATGARSEGVCTSSSRLSSVLRHGVTALVTAVLCWIAFGASSVSTIRDEGHLSRTPHDGGKPGLRTSTAPAAVAAAISPSALATVAAHGTPKPVVATGLGKEALALRMWTDFAPPVAIVMAAAPTDNLQ